MLEKFRSYLIQKGFKEFSPAGNPSSAIDYVWRITKIIERENITEKQLSDRINEYLKLYSVNGEKWCEGRRSHQSYINALRNYRKFLLIQRFAA